MSTTAVEAQVEGDVITLDGVQWTVGDPMDAVKLGIAPLGTTIWNDTLRRRGLYYIKTGQAWLRSDRNVPTMVTARRYYLRSLPRPETLAGFKRRFAEVVMAVTEEYTPTHQRVARQTLIDLGALPSAETAMTADSTPPVGTVAIYSYPDQPDFTVFRYGRSGWSRLAGPHTLEEVGSAVATNLDVEDPYVEVEGDQEGLIGEFKEAVWSVGQQIKQQHQWCSRYDEVLAQFGITDPDGHPDFSNWPVMVKGAEARAELPDGAVLGVARGDWGIFIKENGDWRRIAGTRPLAAGTMHLLFDGVGDLSIHNALPLMDHLPPGTQVLLPHAVDGPDRPFVKTENGRWVRDAIGYTTADFERAHGGPPVVVTCP